jgi:hypothetical protein
LTIRLRAYFYKPDVPIQDKPHSYLRLNRSSLMDLADLQSLFASDAAPLIRDGTISSVQLLEACLARLNEVDHNAQA